MKKMLIVAVLALLSQVSCIGTTATAPPVASDTLRAGDTR